MPSPGPLDAQTSDTGRLPRAVGDMRTLLALPETWAKLDREAIAHSTATALQTMFHPANIRVHLPADADGAALDVWTGDPLLAAAGSARSEGLSAPIGTGGGRISIEDGTDDILSRLLLDMAGAQIATTLSRRSAERAASRLALLVERSSDFIGLARLDGTPEYVNPSGMALVGLTSADQLGGLHILDFMAPAERHRAATGAFPTMSSKGHWIGETALRHFGGGEIIPVLLDCFRIDDQSTGLPTHFATVIRDLRPQKEVERGLREQAAGYAETAQRRALERDDAKYRLEKVQLELFHASRLSVAGQMTGMLAHELSQPLTAALASASASRRLLMTEKYRPDELHELIEDHLIQTERAGTILRRWRNFVCPGSAASRQPEDLRRIVEEAIDFAFIGPDATEVSLQLYFDPGAPAVRVDRIQIQQVIANLVRNALDSLRSGATPTLRLSTFRSDVDTVEILVADNGSGVDAAIRDRMFEPFQSSKADGMGLGLSICRTIVEAHGGTIAYEPHSAGGSVFRFDLPACDSYVAP